MPFSTGLSQYVGLSERCQRKHSLKASSSLRLCTLRLVGRWFDEISAKRISRFGGGRAKQKQELEQKLMSFFERYADTL